MTQLGDAPESVLTDVPEDDQSLVHYTCGDTEADTSKVPLIAYCGVDVTLHEQALQEPTRDRACPACVAAKPAHRRCVVPGRCEVWDV